ncbi:hypothetical protein [Fructilactobacillus sanfranciscensis]|uniref:Uncharacterized protein n=1 Tax=Fructilactobacillus sanfranciscensis TaxID=1625 RepID=A0A5C4TJM9_FRUSA|nr:hypothetical protein [Fructilactobacillus sanfranciscensis]TNK90033.1 hypothetical protein DID87_05635 [Fructilactobacillus sanfranciscensis]TNK95234.1 hypothetical protein DKP74_05790 [Fructilactobacillus sanfranciscensis]TNK97149.1 hypothetical protein DKP75_05420 [Fructilactobacillus sanfranciscensis]TNK98988.1 hypothetical protein DK130_05875 [Fructilactobacillus sanfranciscensis]
MALKGQLPPRKQNNEFNSSDMNQMIEAQLENNQNITSKQTFSEKKKDYHIMMKPLLHNEGIKYANSQGLSFSEFIAKLVEKEINNK